MLAPSSSDRVLQGTLLGPPSPAVAASTSSWDPLSARLSCSRLSDSGKDLKCWYLGDPRAGVGGIGDMLRARVPPAPLPGHSLLQQIPEILLHLVLLVPQGPGQPRCHLLAVPRCPPGTLHQCRALLGTEKGAERGNPP